MDFIITGQELLHAMTFIRNASGFVNGCIVLQM